MHFTSPFACSQSQQKTVLLGNFRVALDNGSNGSFVRASSTTEISQKGMPLSTLGLYLWKLESRLLISLLQEIATPETPGTQQHKDTSTVQH